MNIKELLSQWYMGIRNSHLRHKLAAEEYTRTNRFFGIVVVSTTTLVGTTLFATLKSSRNTSVQIGIASFSILAAILSAVQTFLNYPDWIEKHKLAAAKYGELRKELDMLCLKVEMREEYDFEKHMKSFRTRWNTVEQEAPPIPKNIYKRAIKIMNNSDNKIT